MSENLIFNDLSERKDVLQKKAISLIAGKNKDAGERLKNELGKIEDQQTLKIAFVGQHNAGKSTIVSALTGNKEIKISNNVETDEAADYKWNDIFLTDTPGLFAGIKEEHDIRTLESIRKSDLLVFCITSSLFDDLLINNFVNLAYKQMYKSKMFLLVNKMSQESGEFNTLVNNYNETLLKTLKDEGGNLEDFPVSFVDAHDYIDGIAENDQELTEYSNFKSFIGDLNKYISSRKLSAKLDTPCRIITDAIDTEISETGTELDRSMTAVLRQSQSQIHIHRNNVRKFILDLKASVRNSIMAEANNIIARIGSENVSEEDLNDLNSKIEIITQSKIDELQEYVNSEVTEMFQDIGEVLESDMGQYVLSNVQNKKLSVKGVSVDNKFQTFANKYKGFEQVVSQGATKVASASGVTNIMGKVSQASGSQVHNIVLNVGHFFGKSFKPWEAVKIADKVGKFAKGLGPALAAISVVIDIAGKFKEEQKLKEIEGTKREIFNQFSSIASDIANQIDLQYKACEKELFGTPENEIEDIRSNSIKTIENNSEYVKQLQDLRQNVAGLIEDISKA